MTCNIKERSKEFHLSLLPLSSLPPLEEAEFSALSSCSFHGFNFLRAAGFRTIKTLRNDQGFGSASISYGHGSRVLKTNADRDPRPDF